MAVQRSRFPTVWAQLLIALCSQGGNTQGTTVIAVTCVWKCADGTLLHKDLKEPSAAGCWPQLQMLSNIKAPSGPTAPSLRLVPSVSQE